MTLHTVKQRKEFLAAGQNGKHFITKHFILQMIARPLREGAPDDGLPHIGFTVTKKMGNAVARNRIKRRLREAVAAPLAKHGQPQHNYVLVARHGIQQVEFPALQRDMEFAFSTIIHHKGNNRKPPGKPKS